MIGPDSTAVWTGLGGGRGVTSQLIFNSHASASFGISWAPAYPPATLAEGPF